MAGLVVPISGPSTAIWNARPMGTLNDDGYEISVTFQGQEINASDAYGMTLVEGIWRGFNWRCRIRGLEWDKTGLMNLMQMFGQSGAVGTLTPVLANIGDRWSTYCKIMVITAILANPPATPQTITANQAGVAPQSQNVWQITSKMRESPFEMIWLPYSAVVASTTYAVPFTSL